MKVVYIAGPFTARTAWGIECNVRRAETAALEIAKLGAAVLCPHTNTRHFHGELTEAFWYKATAALLQRCDAVYLLPGWIESRGAAQERELALSQGIPCFSTMAALMAWLPNEVRMMANGWEDMLKSLKGADLIESYKMTGEREAVIILKQPLRHVVIKGTVDVSESKRLETCLGGPDKGCVCPDCVREHYARPGEPHNGGIRGVTFPCENCGALDGSTLDNGFNRCNACGFPGQ